MTRKALGKGLDALFSKKEDEVAVAVAPPPQQPHQSAVSMVDVHRISTNPYQPRHVFDENALNDMVESIKQKGILQPLLVRRNGEFYEIIAGERRYRAAIQAGLSEIPVMIVKANNRDLLEIALIENLQREDLNAIEQAHGFKMLQTEFTLSQEEVASRVGLSREAVTNSLRLLQLPPEVKQMIEGGALSAGHGRILLRLESGHEMIRMAHHVNDKGISVRELERMVQSKSHYAKENRKQTKGDQRFAMVCREAEERLLEAFDTRVKVKPRAGGKRGKIEIAFKGEDELNQLLHKLTGGE